MSIEKPNKRNKKNPLIAGAILTTMLLSPQMVIAKEKRVDNRKDKAKIVQVDRESAEEARIRFEALKKKIKEVNRKINTNDKKLELEKERALLRKEARKNERVFKTFRFNQEINNCLGGLSKNLNVELGIGLFGKEGMRVYYKGKLLNQFNARGLKLTSREVIEKTAYELLISDIITPKEERSLLAGLRMSDRVRDKMKSMGLLVERDLDSGVVKFKNGKGFKYDDKTYQINTKIIPRGVKFFVKDYDGSEGEVICLDDGSVKIKEVKKQKKKDNGGSTRRFVEKKQKKDKRERRR